MVGNTIISDWDIVKDNRTEEVAILVSTIVKVRLLKSPINNLCSLVDTVLYLVS